MDDLGVPLFLETPIFSRWQLKKRQDHNFKTSTISPIIPFMVRGSKGSDVDYEAAERSY